MDAVVMAAADGAVAVAGSTVEAAAVEAVTAVAAIGKPAPA
jgi:hypothetical protein